MIDLQPFCSTDETRWYLTKPFSKGEFSFATNGHIMVRQPRRDDVPEIDAKAPAFDPNAPLAGLDEAMFVNIHAELPPAGERDGPCQACDGRGYYHDCPDCECVCEGCNGTGEADREKHISTSIGGAIFALNYVRQMLTLPGPVEVAHTASAKGRDVKNFRPLFFRFDGGVGALMPRSALFNEHVEIERT